MSEKEEAIALANRVLDKPNIDPDGDICMLARQFLRALELLNSAPPSSQRGDWVLVPREPTEAMVERGRDQLSQGDAKVQTHARVLWVWEAMLNSAPPPAAMESERGAFEAWAVCERFRTDKDNLLADIYVNTATRFAWSAWQARSARTTDGANTPDGMCLRCNGTGQTGAAYSLETQGPKRDRERRQAADDMRVTCWECGGTGKAAVARSARTTDAGAWDIGAILTDVAELPDRTSPEDAPDMMLVTADELRAIIVAHSAPAALPTLTEEELEHIAIVETQIDLGVHVDPDLAEHLIDIIDRLGLTGPAK